MKRLIAYSLYGDKPMYLVGAVRNAESAARFYPGWRARFYVGASVPGDVRTALARHGAEVVAMSGREDASAMFWRFLAFAEPDTERVLIRDCDSRFSERERAAVDEWLDSGEDFHIMRDHPWHNRPILGGLWGARPAALTGLVEQIQATALRGVYGEDQDFLTSHVYPRAKTRACVHDGFFWSEPWRRPFPVARAGDAFVGEAFDEHDQPRASDRALLSRTEHSRLRLLYLRATVRLSGVLDP